jgi:hypothetical protein
VEAASFLVFLFGLVIYTGTFFLVQNQLVDLVVTPDMLTQLRGYTTMEPSAMTDEWFKSTVLLLSAQTALTTYFVFAGVMLMLFADPPAKWFVGGSEYTGNKLVVYAAVVLIVAYLILLMIEPLRSFFQLVPLPWIFSVAIGVLTLAWMFVQRIVWRSNWLERFLDMK